MTAPECNCWLGHIDSPCEDKGLPVDCPVHGTSAALRRFAAERKVEVTGRRKRTRK